MAGSMKQIAKRNAMSPQALVSEWDFFVYGSARIYQAVLINLKGQLNGTSWS